MNYNWLKEKIENLTDEQCKQYFNEIMDYNEKGFMGDTGVRILKNEYKEVTGIDDMGCTQVIIPELLLEFSKRHFGYYDK